MQKRIYVVICLIVLSFFILAGPSPVSATTISLSATDAGFINAEGRTSKNDGVILGSTDATFNYSAGAIDEVSPLSGIDIPRKNFFTFDLGGVTETIVSAELVLYNPSGGYSSPDSSEVYVLGGTIAPGGPSEMATFADDLSTVWSILDSGKLAIATSLYPKVADTLDGAIPDFGSVTVSAADDDSMLSIPIAVDGLDYLNSFLGGPVVLGGLIASLDGSDAGDEVIFGFTKPLISGVVSPDPAILDPTPTPVLLLTTVTVPEPASLLLLSSGLIGLISLKRKWK